MSNRAQAQYLRIYTGGTDKQLWQSYYVNSTISLSSKSWSYFPFTADGLMSSSASGANRVSVTCPATTTARLSNVAPNSNQSLIVNFLGVITDISGTFETLRVRIGSSISPVGASCPPRKFTTDLIGNPIRL